MRAVTNSSSSIILYWLPPSVVQQNGEIRSYNIKMRGEDLIYTKINTKSNSTTFPITGLQAYTNYEFTLQAVNDIGVGPYSNRVSSRTFEAGKRHLTHFQLNLVTPNAYQSPCFLVGYLLSINFFRTVFSTKCHSKECELDSNKRYLDQSVASKWYYILPALQAPEYRG